MLARDAPPGFADPLVCLLIAYSLQDLEKGSFRIHHGVIDKRAGSPGNDPSTYVLRDHLQFSVMDS